MPTSFKWSLPSGKMTQDWRLAQWFIFLRVRTHLSLDNRTPHARSHDLNPRPAMTPACDTVLITELSVRLHHWADAFSRKSQQHRQWDCLAHTHAVCTVQFWQLENLKVFKECGQDGVGVRLVNLWNLATTVYTKPSITYIRRYRNIQVF
jgi:hypothetical protein